MKKLWLVGAIALVAVFTACKKSNGPKQEDLRLQSCKKFNLAGGRVELCFDELISDSRCPVNAMCIWEGAAVAAFTFTEGGRSHRFSLSTSNLPGPEKTDTVIAGYKIKLINIEPYPQQPPVHFPDSDVKATVELTKQ